MSSNLLYTRKELIKLRMLPFFKPKKGFMVAGGGLEASSGGGGGGSGITFSVEETKIGTFNGKDLFSRIIPADDFYYKQKVSIQDTILCDKEYVANIENVLKIFLYEYESNSHQLLCVSDNKGVYGMIKTSKLYGECSTSWDYWYNANNCILIIYTKTSV